MELAIAERLVCPRSHAPTPLVVRADDTAAGRLVRGVVGCPACLSEWRVDGGVLAFGGPAADAPVELRLEPTAIAAFLSLSEPGLIVVADGLDAAVADALRDDYGARVIVLDAGSTHRAAAVINGAERLPFAAGLAAGAILCRPGRSAEFRESLALSVRPGGRVAGVGEAALPGGVRVVARDASAWVAERFTAVAPISLRRRGA